MTALYAIPSWSLLALTCGAAVLIAVVGQVTVHRAFNRLDFLQHNEVGGFIIAVVGTLYSVTLAFVISIVWQEYDASASRAALEAGDAATTWQIAVGLPAPLAERTRGAIARYANIMIDDEWPAMSDGRASPQADALVEGLIHDAATFRPRDAGEVNIQAQILASLTDMNRARHERLADNARGLSAFQWLILVGGGAIVVGFCYLFGLSNQNIHNIMTGSVACLIAAAFVVIYELDYPFHGDLGIPSTPWQAFAQRISGR